MTRHLATIYPDMQDEIAATFSELVPAKEDGKIAPYLQCPDLFTFYHVEWLSVPAYKTIAQIVCRANNRIFVGLPFCS